MAARELWLKSPAVTAVLSDGRTAELPLVLDASRRQGMVGLNDALLALVQSGYRNRFGHPAAPVLERYAQRGIVVHDSPHCGAMQWVSDRPEELQCQRTTNMHYWSHRVP